MMIVWSRKVALYIASIISLLALGVVSGSITAEFGRELLHTSPQMSQAIQTLFIPIFAAILEMVGIHFWFKKTLC